MKNTFKTILFFLIGVFFLTSGARMVFAVDFSFPIDPTAYGFDSYAAGKDENPSGNFKVIMFKATPNTAQTFVQACGGAAYISDYGHLNACLITGQYLTSVSTALAIDAVSYTCDVGAYTGCTPNLDHATSLTVDSNFHSDLSVFLNGSSFYSNGALDSLFTVFSVDPSTAKVSVQGFWTASTTDYTQNLVFYQSSPNLGQENVQSFLATTTGSFSFTIPYLSDTIIQSGSNTTYSLTPNTTFYAQIYQKNGYQNPFTGQGNSPTLLVATSTQLQATSTSQVVNENYQTLYDSTIGSTTPANSSNFLGFLNVPQLLATKVPFAYIFQFFQILNSVFLSSTPTSIPSASFNVVLPLTSTSSTTIAVDLFSTSTVTHFIPSPILNTLRTLMVAVTYFSLGWFLFHEAKSKHLIS